jgi:hypothetical protein
MASQEDFSDLGAVPVDDFSDLGAIPIDNRNAQQNTQSSQAPQDSSLLSDVAHIPYNLAVGAGGGIQNIGHGLLPALIPKFEPQGVSQNIGEPIGNIAGYMLGPEAALLRGARGVQSLAGLGEKGWSALSNRLASGGLYGAINEPQDRAGGATTGVMTAGAGELLGGLLGKALPKAAEFLYPQKYANKLAGDINKGYRSAEKEANELYNPIIEKLGKEKIENSYNYGHPTAAYTRKSEYKKLDDKTFNEYSPNLEKMHQKFMNDPNVKNAHYLQSDMGKEVAELISKNAPKEKIDKIKNGQQLLQQDLNQYLKTNHPGEHQEYQNAGKFYKENVIPYRNEKIYKIATKNQETVTPEELQSSLRQLTELKRGNNSEEYLAPKNHYLNKAYTDISHRINRGEAAGTAGSLGSVLAGGVLGNIFHPGLYGTILGGGLGAGASFAGKRYLMPKVLSLSTNPSVHETLPKLKGTYDALVKSLIGAQTGNG